MGVSSKAMPPQPPGPKSSAHTYSRQQGPASKNITATVTAAVLSISSPSRSFSKSFLTLFGPP